MFKRKKGWIRIVEAVIAILIIMGIVVLYIGNENRESGEIPERVGEAQINILKDIQRNDDFREIITSIDDSRIPVLWKGEFDTNSNLTKIKEKINEKTPVYLSCEAKICKLDSLCEFIGDIDKDVYSKSIAITSTREDYNPRQVKLFCWIKGI